MRGQQAASRGDGHDAAAELKQRVLAQYKVSKLEDLPVNFSGISLQEGEVHGNEVYDKHYSALWRTYARQDRLKQWAGVFAPMLTIGSLSRGLAGTDFAQHQDFAQAAEQYRRVFIKQMNDELAYNGGRTGTQFIAQPALWSKVEAFTYEAPSVGWVLGNQAISVAVLALWFIAAVAVALIATQRMRVE